MGFIWTDIMSIPHRNDNITLKDDFKFLNNVDNWTSHRIFLLLALELTREGAVLELGCGNGSTPFLKNYCDANKRNLYSYDFDKNWADKFGAISINNNWEESDYCDRNYSVALIDESPGRHRGISIKNLMNKVDIFVAHDTEPESDCGYNMSSAWLLFKYISHYKKFKAQATIFSNKYDITKYRSINDISIN